MFAARCALCSIAHIGCPHQCPVKRLAFPDHISVAHIANWDETTTARRHRQVPREIGIRHFEVVGQACTIRPRSQSFNQCFLAPEGRPYPLPIA